MLGSGHATAACAVTGALSTTDISAALGNKWACAKDGSDMWNERITAAPNGTFAECHSGQTSGPDPIDPAKGTFEIVGGKGDPDTITYTYPPSGGSYTYRVYAGSAPSTYTFCRPSDNKVYTVYITTCPPPQLNQCP